MKDDTEEEEPEEKIEEDDSDDEEESQEEDVPEDSVPLYKRVRTPTIIQMEAVECGAASLAIILAYYKCFVTLEELRIACGVSRDGSNLLNMKRAAKHYGLSINVFRLSLDELLVIEPPFIVFWGFDHFLVVEGFSKKHVYINDPGAGPRTISYGEFEKQYSGFAATAELSDNFKRGGRSPSIWPGILLRIKKVKSPLVFLALAGFCIVLTGAIYPGFTKIFFDTILGAKVFSWANGFIFGFLALTALTGVLIGLQQYFLMRLNGRLSIRFSSDYLWHILKLPLSFYQQRFGGEIAYRLSLNDELINSLTGKLATSIINVIFIILYGVMMFALNVEIATIALLSALLNIFATVSMQRYKNDAFALLQQDYGKYMGFAIGGLYYIESIKASGTERNFFSRLMGYFTRVNNTQQRLGEKNIYLTTLPLFLQLLTTTALFGIGGYLILTHGFTIGLFIAFQALLANFMNPMNELMGLGDVVQTVKIDMARIDDVMKNPEDPIFKKTISTVSYKQLEGYLEFRNVTFGYSKLDPPLIKNFFFKLEPGQRVALVGATGCGKTTIARLVSGLLLPWSGEILYDGKKREELSRQQIINSLATIDQEIFLFAGTIKDNITLFDRSASEDEVIRAAKSAYIHDEIVQKPNDYRYMLTEGGSNLSGGQKQRVEIARGLLLNPKILILDEATSALDSKTEEKIINNIRERGCSCLMVAHRLSSTRDCDEIIVLEKGSVMQRGTHEILKKMPGIYRDLVMRDV